MQTDSKKHKRTHTQTIKRTHKHKCTFIHTYEQTVRDTSVYTNNIKHTKKACIVYIYTYTTTRTDSHTHRQAHTHTHQHKHTHKHTHTHTHLKCSSPLQAGGECEAGQAVLCVLYCLCI